ncbi:DEAD/DEAH box helicase (plasmid) [Haladaptatus sp. SPP-AMP-3]|uniref:DEAD/DEAH box helicase n=1 Tax=Haladaptatus sp. SPP-AMP-3 TaxID=3121295 RepID=UPI003C301D51
MKSITEVSEDLEEDHRKYIESTYHLQHPRLLKERRKLMAEGELSTQPWVEASPRYVSGNHFRDLDLPTSVKRLFEDLKGHNLDIYDPPYKHQSKALEAFFADDQDLVVSTGTGSGKTEIFLYSILGQLAREAERNQSTDQRGIRTLVLYPMNALVADQLARMRLLFGNDTAADILEGRMGRTVQFGMYTGRTPYPGEYDEERNYRELAPIFDRFLSLQETDSDLYNDLLERGRIPAKDLEAFRNKGCSQSDQFRTQPGDTELFTRQEMHSPNDYGGVPDILVTNYSMLEYMLLRPIEQPMFAETRQWLEKDEDNQLNIVLDEAHLYHGAQGAEVSLLLNRLLQKLDIPRSRVRFILTSATMGGDVESIAPEFAAELTSSNPDDFEVIEGTRERLSGGDTGDSTAAEAFESVNYDIEESAIRNLASTRNWNPYEGKQDLEKYVAAELESDPVFRFIHSKLREKTVELDELAAAAFKTDNEELAIEATGNLLYLATESTCPDGSSLLPTRLHMLMKGLPSQYICTNPECSGRRETDEEYLLGKLYTTPKRKCDCCESRVFELYSHRDCGAAYLRVFRDPNERQNRTFLWTSNDTASDLEEVHLLVEEPRDDIGPEGSTGRSFADITQKQYLNLTTGHLLPSPPETSSYITVWVPTEEPPDEDYPWCFNPCPACGQQNRRKNNGETKVSDLETKGEEPFANIVRSMFDFQPPEENKKKYPNEGRKVLCFSDGRQKAARLARDLQAHVEQDSFREVVADIMANLLPESTGMDKFFAAFVIYCYQNNIVYFDDHDERYTQGGEKYPGSRTKFSRIQDMIPDLMDDDNLDAPKELLNSPYISEDLSGGGQGRPRQYDAMLLKALGDDFYSLPETLVAYIAPTPPVLEAITRKSDLDEELLETIIIEILRNACNEWAYDPSISIQNRNDVLRYGRMRPEEAGLEKPDIIPEYLKNTVDDRLDQEDWDEVKKLLRKTPGGTRIFERNDEFRFFVNPSAVTLELAVDSEWYRCTGCNKYTMTSFERNCPREGCHGDLETVDGSDLRLETRKSFLRDPPRNVAHGENEPFTLRSEEHTAQLNKKDSSDAFSKTERYELLFQDILLGENEVEQPVDVLSCTTTMEVGIDIGSLTGVAMRTVPPQPENYEQRAGRAGRRGAGLSTIITFADNSPHESHYFNHPEKMVGAEGTDPTIYAGNEKIAQRHINASLIAEFFEPEDLGGESGVFESLGTCSEFFEEDGDQSFERFREWLNENVIGIDSGITDQLGALLPDELGEGRSGDWRQPFIEETAREFEQDLSELASVTDWESEENEDRKLLETLLDQALLPNFSFPIDVCDFVVQQYDRSKGEVNTVYDTSRDTKVALSTYVPGRDIVMDKKTFTSYGVFYKFAPNPVNRAVQENWDSLEWLNICPECNTVYDSSNGNMQGEECDVCGTGLNSVHKYTPPAFAPEVDPDYGINDESTWEEERIYPTPPKYPLTSTSSVHEDSDADEGVIRTKETGIGELQNLSDEELLVANLGPDEAGFEVCRLCGAVDSDGNLSGAHNRPYPKNQRAEWAMDDDDDIQEWTPKCHGEPIQTSFSHDFRSDLTVFRIPIREPMNWAPAAPWFESAAQSLSEGLVLAASRTLGIDADELEGGFRTRDATEDDTEGYLEVYLFDTTPGGAGFAARVWEEFDATLDTAKEIFADCDCDSSCHACLNVYQNRHLHDSLNRHLGHDLLTYAQSGDAPTLTANRREWLATQIRDTLELLDEKNEVVQNPDGAWSARSPANEVTFDIRSCLRTDRSGDGAAIDHDFSSYELTSELPRITFLLNHQL